MAFRFHRHLGVLAAAAVLAGAVSLAYAWSTRPLVEATAADIAGQFDAAADRYRAASQRLAGAGIVAPLLTEEQATATFNHLHLLYRTRAYDAVIAQAAAAPSEAAGRFWSGTALLARALQERQADAQLVWLTRAEEDLKQALQAAPDDWDARFNYEIAARLAAQLRRQPQKQPNTPLQLLRPQPPQQPNAPRRAG